MAINVIGTTLVIGIGTASGAGPERVGRGRVNPGGRSAGAIAWSPECRAR